MEDSVLAKDIFDYQNIQTDINSKGHWFTHGMKESSNSVGFIHASMRKTLGSDSVGFLYNLFSWVNGL